jgi:hypothetical protein
MLEEYKQKDISITQEEFGKMSIGDIRKSLKGQSIVRQQISQTVNLNAAQKDDEALAI